MCHGAHNSPCLAVVPTKQPTLLVWPSCVLCPGLCSPVRCGGAAAAPTARGALLLCAHSALVRAQLASHHHCLPACPCPCVPTEHIRLKLQKHDLLRIYPNLVVSGAGGTGVLWGC